MKLREFIALCGLEDKLPFIIDCEIAPTANTGATEDVYPGLSLPAFGSLTMKEVYVFDALDLHTGVSKGIARLEGIILEMATELSRATDNPNLVECVGHVYSTPEEVQQHPNFPKYLELTQGLRDELADVSRVISNPMVRWAKCTFLLMSRHDANWTFEQTTNLAPEQLDALDDFIRSEKEPAASKELEGFTTPEEASATPELPTGK